MSENKSPLPFIATIILGGALLVLGTKKKQNPIETSEELPSSIDYEDENLQDAMQNVTDDSDEDEE